MIYKRPKILNDLISKYEEEKIIKIEVCRSPITPIFEKILNVLTFNQFYKKMNDLSYDNLYHLYIIITLENNVRVALEKNQRVNVIYDPINGVDCKNVNLKGKELTLYNLIRNAEIVDKFYKYTPFLNNCQKFTYDTLKNSNLMNKDLRNFILQDVKDLAPKTLQKLADKLIIPAAWIDYLIRGGGNSRKLA